MMSEKRQAAYASYFKEIQAYVENESFQELLELYGFTGKRTGKLYEDICMYAAFAEEHWDFRKKHGGGERSSINAADTEDLVDWKRTISLLDGMGVMNTGDLSSFPVADYILPLGGASDSNRTRVILAKDAYDHFRQRDPQKEITVCALSAERPLLRQQEIDITEKFAPGARTEYDAITESMHTLFEVDSPKIITNEQNENIHLCWKLSEFATGQENLKCYSMSAPSSDPTRRANTLDTFIHFLNEFEVKEGQRILLCSTAIYKAYQLTSLLPYALDRGAELSFAGRPSNPQLMQSTFVPNVLQEVNAGLKAMKLLIEKVQKECNMESIPNGKGQ